MKENIQQPYSYIPLDTDAHHPTIWGLEDPVTHQLARLVIHMGKRITITHRRSTLPLYTSSRDVRPELPMDDEYVVKHEKPVMQFYVLEVHGIFMGKGVIRDADVIIALTKDKNAPKYQLHRDNFQAVVYPKDKVKIR